jgi:hypothetical protein
MRSGIYVGPHISQDSSTPDGDGYYVRCYTGKSESKYAVTKPGTHTIAASDISSGLSFTADWAASHDHYRPHGEKKYLGARFIVKIGNDWYGSEQFGMDSSDHGKMNAHDVSSWQQGQTVTTKSNWYLSLAGLPYGYQWRDGNQWSKDPIVAGGGLPSGDISQFGIAWLTTHNDHYVAVDNFQVTPLVGAHTVRQGDRHTCYAKMSEERQDELCEAPSEVASQILRKMQALVERIRQETQQLQTSKEELKTRSSQQGKDEKQVQIKGSEKTIAKWRQYGRKHGEDVKAHYTTKFVAANQGQAEATTTADICVRRKLQSFARISRTKDEL